MNAIFAVSALHRVETISGALDIRIGVASVKPLVIDIAIRTGAPNIGIDPTVPFNVEVDGCAELQIVAVEITDHPVQRIG